MDFRVATWNMDHWKRTPEQRTAAWLHLGDLDVDIALLQETVPADDLPQDHVIWREIGGHRRFGSAVVSFGPRIEEISSVTTCWSPQAFPLYNTFPGSVVVARVRPRDAEPITVVSVYGLIDLYSTTTMLRIAADLTPLFDSADGVRVILAGDLNISTCMPTDDPEYSRYVACFQVLEGLGLEDLFKTAKRRPAPVAGCPCGSPDDCYHVQTHRNSKVVGTDKEHLPDHSDYVFATPPLASRCERILLDDDPAIWDLSDHRPVIAEFDLRQEPTQPEDRIWDEQSFCEEVRGTRGGSAANVFARVMSWATSQGLRLEFNEGLNGQCWAMLDQSNDHLQWTFSVRTRGDFVIQFQNMRPPFKNMKKRDALRQALITIPGIVIDHDRLKGRPPVDVSALEDPVNLDRFLAVFSDMIAETRRFWGL